MSLPIHLGVNIDHVATLRQARGTPYPAPLQAALIAQKAGADSITVHLREDRRHIQDADVFQLQEELDIPLNLEMAITDEMLTIAERLKPRFCCFVPERRAELTTEGGLDVARMVEQVRLACQRLSDAGICVSLFIDAERGQIEAAKAAGTEVVELHTGAYADAMDEAARDLEFAKIVTGVHLCESLGIQINAGHGLHYENVQAIAAISQVHELNIGHSIVAKAVFTGFEKAVSEMKRLMVESHANQVVT